LRAARNEQKRKGEPSNVDDLTAVLQELLQKHIESQGALATHDAGRHLRLNFDNVELKKVMPWTGIHQGQSMALQGCA
jgi:hypothetical protein